MEIIGDKVKHNKYGEGIVVDIKNQTVTVKFSDNSIKKISRSFLENLSSTDGITKVPLFDNLFIVEENKAIKYLKDHEEGKIVDELKKIGYMSLVHFTKISNLESILKHGLLSVNALNKNDINFDRNDYKRIDGELDGISLSIESINQDLLKTFKKKFDVEFIIILIKPSLLYRLFNNQNGNFKLQYRRYYNYNAAAKLSKYSETDINIMFEKFREGIFYNHGSNITPELQAEIMFYDTIPLDFIRKIIRENGEVLYECSWAAKYNHIRSKSLMTLIFIPDPSSQ